MSEAPSESGFNLNIGTVEEGKAMIGYRTDVSFNEVEVNWPMIMFYASALEDANAAYWDKDFAEANFGGVVSPPGLAMVWSGKMDWKPQGAETVSLVALQIPLPGTTVINVATETEFMRPILVGEQLNVVDEVISVSDEKTTKLGVGNFITTCASYRTSYGEVVMKNTNTLFRFRPLGEN